MKNYYMNLAYEEALKAYEQGEVPVGAIIVYNNEVIAKAHNKREKLQKVYAHAEFLAIKEASEVLGSWRLNDCDLYITLEPCAMCAGAIIESRIKNVYFSTNDLKRGASGSIIDLFDLSLGYKVNVEKIDDLGKSQLLLKNFFKSLRNKE